MSVNLARIDRMQESLWRGPLAEPVELVDAAGVVVSSHRAIAEPPVSVDAPGTASMRTSTRVTRSPSS